MQAAFGIRQNAYYVVERCKPNTACRTMKESKVLRMGVRRCDNPVKYGRVDEPLDVLRRAARVISKKVYDIGYAGSAFILVLVLREDSYRLTDVFLMDSSINS